MVVKVPKTHCSVQLGPAQTGNVSSGKSLHRSCAGQLSKSKTVWHSVANAKIESLHFSDWDVDEISVKQAM